MIQISFNRSTENKILFSKVNCFPMNSIERDQTLRWTQVIGYTLLGVRFSIINSEIWNVICLNSRNNNLVVQGFTSSLFIDDRLGFG
jgi:hypothetical protein